MLSIKIDIYSEKIITVQSSYQRSNVVLFYSIILSTYITLVRLGTGLFPCIGRQSFACRTACIVGHTGPCTDSVIAFLALALFH